MVRPLPFPVSCCVKKRKKILSLEGTPEHPYPRPFCFLQLGLRVQLQRRLLCISGLKHSRTPDPSPSTRTQCLFSSGTHKRRPPASVSPNELDEFPEFLPIRITRVASCTPVSHAGELCVVHAVVQNDNKKTNTTNSHAM